MRGGGREKNREGEREERGKSLNSLGKTPLFVYYLLRKSFPLARRGN